MATRSTKTIAPVAPIAAVKRTARTEQQTKGLDQTHAADVDSEDFSFKTYMAGLKAQFKLTWTRERVIGLVLGLATSFSVGYVLGAVVYTITLAAFAATTSMFLALVIYALGTLLVLWAGGKLGTAVFEYVGSGAAREHVGNASRWVRGLFSRSDAVAA